MSPPVETPAPAPSPAPAATPPTSGSRWLPGLYALALAALLALPLYWSLHTPFGLIDDYSDLLPIHLLQRADQFRAWLGEVFSAHSAARFRPCYDLERAFAWTLLGDHPALHHAWRWVLKFATGALGLLALWTVVRPLPDARRRFTLMTGVFLTLYFFTPNNPEARLLPQELLVAFFLALVNLALARLLARSGGLRLDQAPAGDLALLLLAFLGLATSKEPAVALCAAVFGGLLVWHLGRWPRPRALVVLLALLLITAWLAVHVLSYARHSAYGVPTQDQFAPLSVASEVVLNLFGYSTHFLLGLGLTLLVLTAVWPLPLHLRWPLTPTPADATGSAALAPSAWFTLALAGEALAFLAMTSASWLLSLRYWYPLVPLLAALAALGVWRLSATVTNPRRWRALTLALLLGEALFIGANYHNYLHQFHVQIVRSQLDHAVLADLQRRLQQGATLVSPGPSEPASAIRYYFAGDSGSLPVTYQVLRDIPLAPATPLTLVVPTPENPRYAPYERLDEPVIACPGRTLAYWLQVSNPLRLTLEIGCPVLWTDEGAAPMPNHAWFFGVVHPVPAAVPASTPPPGT